MTVGSPKDRTSLPRPPTPLRNNTTSPRHGNRVRGHRGSEGVLAPLVQRHFMTLSKIRKGTLYFEICFRFNNFTFLSKILPRTVENRRFDQCILDWTNQCKSRLPLVTKSAFLQTATAAHVSGPIYETFLCSGSLKPDSFG